MIEIKNLTKRFDNILALNDVTITVEKGQVYGLVGSNGSGKSTLLRILSGIFMPDSGTVTIDGEAVYDNPKIKEKIAFVSDSPCFFLHANLIDMAKFYAQLYPRFSFERLEEINKIFPIDKKAKLQNMSKGMQRQAAVMLALACQPDYLFLDEAFDGLDPVMRDALKGIIACEIEDNGLTVIISSHNLRELEELCDSVGLIHFSDLVFSKAVSDIKTDIHKIQTAFKNLPEELEFNELELLKSERTGNLIQLIVKGDMDKIKPIIEAVEPIFFEEIPLTLEEIFIYELGGKGYDVSHVIQ